MNKNAGGLVVVYTYKLLKKINRRNIYISKAYET